MATENAHRAWSRKSAFAGRAKGAAHEHVEHGSPGLTWVAPGDVFSLSSLHDLQRHDAVHARPEDLGELVSVGELGPKAPLCDAFGNRRPQHSVGVGVRLAVTDPEGARWK